MPHGLIKFRHGLGDAVQLTAVLLHLERLRPDWKFDVVSGIGKHSAYGHLANHSHIDSVDPAKYDRVWDTPWNECHHHIGYCQHTKVALCLMEEFAIVPQRDLSTYQIPSVPEAVTAARRYLTTVCQGRIANGTFPAVIIHAHGNTSQAKKNMADGQVIALCEWAKSVDLVPIILDWDRRTMLYDQQTVFCPDVTHEMWGGTGTGDAAIIAALIQHASLCVAIDSGPQKIAGATTTPTLAVWLGHHPVQFYDFADNVTHFVPTNHHQNALIRDRRVRWYFEEWYVHLTYRNLLEDMPAACEFLITVPDLVKRDGHWIRRNNEEQDQVIVRDVFDKDCYGIHSITLPSNPVIVDVGAHIGMFAKKAHSKWARAKIICVEACQENMEALGKNCENIALCMNSACTYETGEIAMLNAVYPNCRSTGGSRVMLKSEVEASTETDQYWKDLRDLPSITLGGIMELAGTNHIDLLKLDCEGSEFSILSNGPIDCVGLIVGEWHGTAQWRRLIAEKFGGWGYNEMIEEGADSGLFALRNPNGPHDS